MDESHFKLLDELLMVPYAVAHAGGGNALSQWGGADRRSGDLFGKSNLIGKLKSIKRVRWLVEGCWVRLRYGEMHRRWKV